MNVGDLEAFDANSTVDMAALKSRRLVIGTFDDLRVLGDGELTKKLTVKANHFSEVGEGRRSRRPAARAT